MAGMLQESTGDEAVVQPPVGVANSFIATVYFRQATSMLNRGLFADAEAYFREVLRLWPDHAGSLNNLGTAVLRQGRVQEAERYYRRARALEPNDCAILNNLGNLLWEQGRLEQALRRYRRAIRLQPDHAAALSNLGVTLSDLGRFDEALVPIRQSLRLLPDSPEGHVNLGITLARQGKLDEALLCYEQALGLRPDFPEARRNRAYIWLARGDFERGWAEYEWRQKCPRFRPLTVNRPRWTGEDLQGRSILLHAEQGLGDTLQVIRFAPLVRRRGGRVLVACHPPLVPLLARCPDVDLVVDWKKPLPDCDVHAPLMSLPALFGTTLDNLPAEIPYLSVDTTTVEYWRPVVARALGLAPGDEPSSQTKPARVFKIGIAWQGNRANQVDSWRSVPLTHFAHLAEIPGVRLISLQKDDGVEQLARLGGRFPVAELRQPDRDGEDRRDFLDTAAVMSQLDLVVTPDTATAHLAGSLGVRVWVALPTASDWRWLLDREDSPWYPTMRLFRQTTFRDWDGVFERMAGTLRKQLA